MNVTHPPSITSLHRSPPPLSPEKCRRVYQQATRPASPLRTTLSLDREPHAAFVRNDPRIRRRFLVGPSLMLDHEEQPTAILPTPPPDNPSAPPLVAVDARTLQYPFFNGSKQHAMALLDILCPEWDARKVPYTFLVSPDRPPLNIPHQSNALAWSPDLAERATAFLNPDPLHSPADPLDLPLLTRPGVWRCAVWLDAIIGMHPHAFLPDYTAFQAYQTGLQKLACMHDLLCISRSSLQEARQIFGERIRLHLTPCQVAASPCRPGSLPPEVPAHPYVMAMANAFPHKNAALFVCGAAAALLHHPDHPHLVLVGNLDPAQVETLHALAAELHLPPERFRIHTRLPGETLAALRHHARAMVIPSLHEGFSLPVVEALRDELPVCVSDIPAHRELLGDAPGFFDPSDPVDLARSLRAILQNRGQSLELQQAQLQSRVHPEQTRSVLTELLDLHFPV